jgi:hypothetical protein
MFVGHSLFSVTRTNSFSSLITAMLSARYENKTVTLRASGAVLTTSLGVKSPLPHSFACTCLWSDVGGRSGSVFRCDILRHHF